MSSPVVLLVSKPLAPPWNDSGKNLVYHLARQGQHYRYRLLTTRNHSQADASPNLTWEPIYTAPGRFAPPLGQNLRVLGRLLAHDDAAIRHFFFAPNWKSSTAARLIGQLRRVPTVQSVMSAPRVGASWRNLIFGDRVIALSDWSERKLLDSGLPAARVVRIYPGVELPALAQKETLAKVPRVIYAGDYEFSSAASTVAQAIPLVLAKTRATFIFACRHKTHAAHAHETAIRRQLEASAPANATTFLHEIDDMPSFLGTCDICVLPADTLYAKMDLPLVLLEAMARAVPVVVADVEPLREVIAHGGGVAVPAADPVALANQLVALLADPTRRRALGAEARRAAETHFDIRAAARQTEQVYDSLLS